MTSERLNAEKQVLSRFLPANTYLFRDLETSRPYILMAAKTNRGNVYTIRIDLQGFPNSLPHAFVTKMLKTKTGEVMDMASASMHTLTSEYGYTRICHYGFSSWGPNVSLYKVFIKCRLWLEMYEQHLKTGKPMDYYLNHQA